MDKDEMVIRNLRSMAWERAKGELRSMTHTFWMGSLDPDSQFSRLSGEISKFILEIEDNGLHE